MQKWKIQFKENTTVVVLSNTFIHFYLSSSHDIFMGKKVIEVFYIWVKASSGLKYRLALHRQ
jgi:hypothetical protein